MYIPGCHFATGTACPVGWPSHACKMLFLPHCTAPKGPTNENKDVSKVVFDIKISFLL